MAACINLFRISEGVDSAAEPGHGDSVPICDGGQVRTLGLGLFSSPLAQVDQFFSNAYIL